MSNHFYSLGLTYTEIRQIIAERYSELGSKDSNYDGMRFCKLHKVKKSNSGAGTAFAEYCYNRIRRHTRWVMSALNALLSCWN